MGIKHEELKGLVVPLISIDEFEPKLGTVEEVIVVAFFTKEELVAYDLDDFIDKGVTEYLDSEVSPNPNTDGYYLVFVEFNRQPNFWNKLYALVKDIENATGKMKWRVQPYLSPELYDLYDEELHTVVITDEEKYVSKKEFEEVPESYFYDSDLLKFKLKENKALFGGRRGTITFDFLGFGNTEELIKKHNLLEHPLNLNSNADITSLRLMLGENWDITQIEDYLFISKLGDSRSVVLRR